MFAPALRLPAPQPELLSHNTVPIMLADTLQVVLCIQRSCFHNVTVAEGWGGRGQEVSLVEVQSEKPQRKDQSVFKLRGRSAVKLIFMKKRSAGRLRSVWESRDLKNTSSSNQPQQFLPSTQVNDP